MINFKPLPSSLTASREIKNKFTCYTAFRSPFGLPRFLFYGMNHFNKYLLASLYVFFGVIELTFGQPVIVWDKVYGSYRDDNGIQLIASEEGGCVFTAWPYEAGNGDIPSKKGERDVWACKLDANGEIVYSRVLGGSQDDYAGSVIGTADGGAIFQYGTLSSDFDIPYRIGEYDVVFHKLDAAGKTAWVNVFGSTGGDSGLALQKEDGNFLMYLYYSHNDGDLEGVENDGPGSLVIEFDQECSPLWKMPIDFQRGDEVFDTRIYNTSDGGIVFGVSSTINPDNKGESDNCIWKYSPEKIIEWESCFGGEDSEIVADILELPNGGFLIGGITWSKGGDITNPLGSHDIWVVQLDKDGNMISQRTLGGSGLDGISKIFLADEGKSAILLCHTASDDGDVSFNHWGFDIWLVKIDLASNNIIWEKTYGSSTGSERAVDMVELEDGSFIVLGRILGEGQDGDVTDQTTNVLHSDLWIFKLAPEGIQKREECGGFTLSPNPLKSHHLSITFETLSPSDSDVRVFDVRGALIAEYPGALLKNSWKTEIDLPKNLPSGVYLVQVTGCNSSPQTGRFLKVN